MGKTLIINGAGKVVGNQGSDVMNVGAPIVDEPLFDINSAKTVDAGLTGNRENVVDADVIDIVATKPKKTILGRVWSFIKFSVQAFCVIITLLFLFGTYLKLNAAEGVKVTWEEPEDTVIILEKVEKDRVLLLPGKYHVYVGSKHVSFEIPYGKKAILKKTKDTNNEVIFVIKPA